MGCGFLMFAGYCVALALIELTIWECGRGK